MATVEEQRAAAYRTELAARAVAVLARRAALAGDPVARAALGADWAPVFAYQQEQRSDRARRDVPRVAHPRRHAPRIRLP